MAILYKTILTKLKRDITKKLINSTSNANINYYQGQLNLIDSLLNIK